MVENEAKTEWGRIGIPGPTIDGLEGFACPNQTIVVETWRNLHDPFANLGNLEEHAMVTTSQSDQEILNAVRELVATGNRITPRRKGETQGSQLAG
jgi:hypothetical protein